MTLADPSTFFIDGPVQMPANPSKYRYSSTKNSSGHSDGNAWVASKNSITPPSSSSRTDAENHESKDSHLKNNWARSKNGQLPDGAKAMAVLTQGFTLEEKVNQLAMRISRMEDMLIGTAKSHGPSLSAGPGPTICSEDLVESVGPAVITSHNPSLKDSGQTLSRYMPLAIRNLQPYRTVNLSNTPLDLAALETFPLSFLKSVLGGEEFSPGFCHETKKSPIFKGQTYYIIDRDVEPYLPLAPGEHGAKLSVFFNEFDEATDQYLNVPLFISTSSSSIAGKERAEDYVYFGQYSQLRWSDKLDCDRIQEVVPHCVRGFWADLLTAKNRPEWLTKALMEHFWPKPIYEGKLPGQPNGQTDTNETAKDSQLEGEGKGSTLSDEVKQDMKDFVDDLADWNRMARMKASMLSRDNIIKAFEAEDAGAEPGLRFWWEYLQCIGFDRNFYYQLATEKKKMALMRQ